jgi:hypothetical protein
VTRQRGALARDTSSPRLRALERIGWRVKRQSGTLERDGWPDYVFAFHEGDELGPRAMARVGRATGLRPLNRADLVRATIRAQAEAIG